MKKTLAMLLALVMVLGLFAACGDKKTTTKTPEAPAVELDPTEMLTNMWTQVGEDNQFYVMGGNVENYVDGAPGEYNMEYKENLTYNLLIPEAELANVEAASFMQHGMNANNFTAGIVKYTGDVTAFAATMQSAIQNNQWMCGFPETLVIAQISDGYVLICFGINDAMDLFIPAVTAAYADANILYNEAIGG